MVCLRFRTERSACPALCGAEVDEDYIAHYMTLASDADRADYLPQGCAPARRLRSCWPARKRANVSAILEDRGSSPLPRPPDEDYIELLRERFDRAVPVRLRTIGGIGAELSGGLDSSSVAATAAGILAKEGREMTAYTAVPRADFRGTGLARAL